MMFIHVDINKIQTRNNSVFGHFSCSVKNNNGLGTELLGTPAMRFIHVEINKVKLT